MAHTVCTIEQPDPDAEEHDELVEEDSQVVGRGILLRTFRCLGCQKKITLRIRDRG